MKPTDKNNDQKQEPASAPKPQDNWLRHLSVDELANLGVNYVAYVKPMTVDGVEAYGIFGADGEQIGVTPGRDTAFAAIRQHDLEPLSVH